MKNKNNVYRLLILSVLMSTPVLAEKLHQHKPPKEAFVACENKAEGDLVSFISPKGDTIEASCKLMKAVLIAVPAKAKKHQHDHEHDHSHK
ncbi:hypothetical protein [Thalassotalea agariperforans]